jgi:hypothetical protein
MPRLSAKLRSVGDSLRSKGIMFWCPGCKLAHIVWYDKGVQGSSGPVHQWNGDVEEPSCWPAIRHFVHKGARNILACHYRMVNGHLVFFNDCDHSLSGLTVEIPDWPYTELDDGKNAN